MTPPLPFLLALLLLTAAFASHPSAVQAQADDALPDDDAVATALDRLQQLSPLQMDEVLWLARGIYSESNRAHEQYLVAWVIRNRVETDFRGTSYRNVVLAPRQFSAFNDPTPRRTYLLSLDQTTTLESWRTAVAIAFDVYHAPVTDRPFARSTRHFYSPISMQGRAAPRWAESATPLAATELGVDPQRFRFYDTIDLSLDPFEEEALDASASASTVPRAPRRLSRRSGRTLQPSGKIQRPTPPAMQVRRPVRPKPPAREGGS